MLCKRNAFLASTLVFFLLLISGCNSSSVPEVSDDLSFSHTGELSETLIQSEEPVDTPSSEENTDAAHQPELEVTQSIDEGDSMIKIIISVGDNEFSALFYNNETSQAMINKMPFTVALSDFNGQEKVGTLSETPSASLTEKPTTIYAGELYIWSGDSLVLFYTTFTNTYGGYVPLGYIEDTSSLADTLGSGDVEAAFRIV